MCSLIIKISGALGAEHISERKGGTEKPVTIGLSGAENLFHFLLIKYVREGVNHLKEHSSLPTIQPLDAINQPLSFPPPPSNRARPKEGRHAQIKPLQNTSSPSDNIFYGQNIKANGGGGGGDTQNCTSIHSCLVEQFFSFGTRTFLIGLCLAFFPFCALAPVSSVCLM